jgi:hypothetical protein
VMSCSSSSSCMWRLAFENEPLGAVLSMKLLVGVKLCRVSGLESRVDSKLKTLDPNCG